MRGDFLDLDMRAVGSDEEELVLVAQDRLGDMGIGGEQIRREGPSRALSLFALILLLGDEIDRRLEAGERRLREFLLGPRARGSISGSDLVLEVRRAQHEISDRAGEQQHQQARRDGTEPPRLGHRVAPRFDLRLRARVGQIGRLLGDLNLEGRSVLWVAQSDNGTVGDHGVVVGGNAVDLNIALAEQVDPVIAGDLAHELAMSLANHGVFGGIDDLAVALASEGDGVDRIPEGLLFGLTLGESAFDMSDGDGHGTLPVRY